MKIANIIPSLLLVVSSACSTPGDTDSLTQTNRKYQAATNNPDMVRYAPLELNQAGQAIAKAQDSVSHHDNSNTSNNLIYLAKQKLALAEEVSKRKIAEAEASNVAKTRDQARLIQRTAEADQANANTRQAQQETQIATANSQQLQAALTALRAKQTARGMVITLGDILFRTDHADLNQNGRESTARLARILQENPQRKLMIEGFTDNTGSMAHNQKLSEERAMAVRTALQNLGIEQHRMAVHAYGQSYPVAGNRTAVNRQLNRRVEIVLSDDNGHIPAR